MILPVCAMVARWNRARSIQFVTIVRRAAVAIAAIAFTSQVAAASLDDTFDGDSLDWCRYEDTSYQGTVSQGSELTLSPSGAGLFTSARVHTQARLIGDFDLQVDYRLGGGLQAPVTEAGAHLDVTLGLYWDEAHFNSVARTRNPGGDGVFAYAASPSNYFYLPADAQAGTLRVVRSADQARFYHRASGSAAWIGIGTMNVPTTPVVVTLGASSIGVARSFSASFDNLKLSAGTTDDIDYVQPTFFHKRDDFPLAAFVENYPVQRYWRGKWKEKDFFDYARESGFDWVKTSVTTRSAPELAATPPDHWGTLPWQEAFWSAREFAAETLKQAQARGLRQEVQLLLSPHAAYWGYQDAPDEWAGKSPDEIAPLLEQNVFDTVTYFRSKGLNVEKYAIGNEVDVGILNFLPGQRITVPAGVGAPTDLQWLRDNVWPIEAQLLKAAAAGVKRADPAAKIILHIAGLEFTPGNVFAPAFFQTMHDSGVPFDYAALSHPYATTPWKLDRYPAACWFKRLALTVDRIHAATGKPTMMVEGDYPATISAGIIDAPMPGFPFTPDGQAAWVREQLRFATGQPNVMGWHYFYPDMASDVISVGGAVGAAEIPLAATSLFETSTVPRPALAEFRVNLASFASAMNQHGFTGSWYNPATGGQGLELEVYPDLPSIGQGVVFAGWFTYDATAAGGQRWYAMQGAVSNTSSISNLTIATGYGGNFNASPAVNGVVVGQATLQFSDCNSATLNYNFTDGSGRSGTVPLTRLTGNVTCSASGDNGNAAGGYLLSGNWYDAKTGGQGLIFDINPAQKLLFAAWYTFAPDGQQIGGPGSQRWYVMQGTYTAGLNSVTNIPIAIGAGGVFDNPTPTQTVQVGTANVVFQSCNAITLSYTFAAGTNQGLSGSVNLVRVGPTPAGCSLLAN